MNYWTLFCNWAVNQALPKPRVVPKGSNITDRDRKLIAYLKSGPKDTNDISRATGRTTATTRSRLEELRSKGIVTHHLTGTMSPAIWSLR